ncbi:MAG: PaaI family thioesterase [Coriobacteriales bacterium]|jgi:acyl-coenzyme A thioesterase PaaI-like protein|nr:PaaI family thioesterase [Coriobacteriales bacterium]
MKYDLREKGVASAQNVSDSCLVCGTNNLLSLQAQFLNLDDGSICALFTALPEHQGYPGRVHGGIISAVIDETIGRSVQTRYPEVFGVTIELCVRFRAPVPVGERLKVIARLDRHSKRVYEGSAELVLSDGTVAAQGTAKYLRLEPEQIVDGGLGDINWIPDGRDLPKSIEA